MRGLVVAARGWRRWVRVHDYREAAEQSEKLADKFAEIRGLTLFRWKITGVALAVSVVSLAILDLIYGHRVLWIAGVVASAALAILGRQKDGSPGRKAALAGPRSLAWTMDPQILVDAFRDAKLIGKDESLRLVERAKHQGGGWAVTVDLPATRKAADVVKHREDLASALAVDEIQLNVERVRGNGGHAGRVAMWVADEDPYAKPPIPTPLLVVERWDAWRPVPFGTDARGRRITLPLVWTSLLIGALPRQGKTMAERLAAAGLILDPHVRLYVADFKNGKDWKAAEKVAHRFMTGDDAEHVLAFLDYGNAEKLIEPLGGVIVDEFFDVGQSRSVPWERRPEASRLLAALKDPNRGWNAIVVGEGTRCWFGNQFSLVAPKFAAYGVDLWVPELGAKYDSRNPSHKMLMSMLGGIREGERLTATTLWMAVRIRTRERRLKGAVCECWRSTSRARRSCAGSSPST